MDSITTKQIFSDHLDVIFAYSYSLVPDELLAQQLAIDSFTQLLCSKQEQIYGKEDFIQELFQIIFSLAKRRSQHFTCSGNWRSDERSYFYQLKLESRAIMFLREKAFMSFHQVAYILDRELDFIQSEYLQVQLKLHDIMKKMGRSEVRQHGN